MSFRMLTNKEILLAIASKVTNKIAAIRSDRRGLAAIEFSLFVGLLAFSLLNTADVSIYIYQRMELENAAQMGAQAARWFCNNPPPPQLPATTNCPGLTTAITNAIQSTSLG